MNSAYTKVSLCIAIAIFASSCSYVTMQRPDELEKDMPVCVSNRLAPSIDSTIAAASAISTIVFATIAVDWATRERSRYDDTRGVAAGTSLFAAGSAVFGAPWTASAVSGFKRAKACEELKNNYVDERRAARDKSAGQDDVAGLRRGRRGSR
jgi:hypothetical protein